MTVTIKYFGAVEEVTGIVEESLAIDESQSLEDIKQQLLSKYAGMNELSFQLAVNQTLTESTTLKDGDEVAVLPPFAGG
ncbi:MoaD/ThiS family protein [Ekhidna sp.]|uniref:MoaD/ThiS family protein n=1 Tax=Ekhidna sp. TaxID=2608089 RepID=UPI003B5A7A23